MKLLKLLVVPALALVMCAGYSYADEGLLGRMMHGSASEQKAPTDNNMPQTQANTADANTEKANESQPGMNEKKTSEGETPEGRMNRREMKNKACVKGMKTCLDPEVEEIEEQVWICQTCPCMVIVKKAGKASLHHCDKPMCLKEDVKKDKEKEK